MIGPGSSPAMTLPSAAITSFTTCPDPAGGTHGSAGKGEWSGASVSFLSTIPFSFIQKILTPTSCNFQSKEHKAVGQ